MQQAKLVIWASGRGSNFLAIQQKIDSRELRARIVGLITNSSRCKAAEEAGLRGIHVYHISTVTHPDENEREQALLAAVKETEAHLQVLCGYMKKIPDSLMHATDLGMINIHPSLLPAFGGSGYYGMKVHQAVIEAGVFYSGVTVHQVEGEYDTGKILAQNILSINEDETAETLASRVLELEHNLYWKVIRNLLEQAELL